MIKPFDENSNKILDEIIIARRTIRAFTKEAPPRDCIEQILAAGLMAPYAALAVAGREDFRRLIVFSQGTPAMAEAERLIQRAVRKRIDDAVRARGRALLPTDPDFAFLDRAKAVADHGHPSLKTAPYYIVVAEYQGIPAAGLQSLAHTLENMWLKATALGLAFQLVSVTESLSEDKDFVKLLGLPYGEFVLDGCVIGYPAAEPPPVRRPQMAAAVKWL